MTTVVQPAGPRIEYVSAAEQAKMIRKALAKAFPGTKFYVRSDVYAGGASIRIYYDGTAGYEPPKPGQFGSGARIPKEGAPTLEAVKAVTDPYEGGGFDGMIDLAYSIDRFVDADGAIVGSETLGTEGSRGMRPAFSSPPAVPARRVSFAGKYVFTEPTLPFDVREKMEASK